MKTPEEIAREIKEITTDWNGARMVDGEPPRIVPSCGELRAIAAAIRAEREAREKAEREYSALLTTWAESRERHLTAEARAEKAEAERDEARKAVGVKHDEANRYVNEMIDAKARASRIERETIERCVKVAKTYQPSDSIGDTMRDTPESAEEAAENIAAAIRALGPTT